ncbi:MAG: beta strand repeat-containing protein [Candidatus Acidiferrales bacterium]
MKKLSLLLTFVLGFVWSGCGGSSAPPAVTISLSPATAQSIDDGQSINVVATVANDSLAKGVSWSLNGVGALAGQTTTSVTYNAPASGAAATATITATSVADGTKTASLTVNVTPIPAITTTSLPAATQGAAYNQTIAKTGGAGTLTFTISAGNLPAGLTMDSSGHITGTPTTIGSSTFTVKLTDSGSPALSATQQLTIAVNPAPLLITTTSLPNGITTKTYSATLQSSGGTGTVTWSVSAGSLPTGLVLNAATGVISGTPTTAGGPTNFTVKATDSAAPTPQTNTQALSITVIPVLSITTTTLPNGTVQTAYSQTLQSSGGSGAVTWSITAGTLPAGLTLNPTSGVIAGTPTAPGTSNFTVQATDSGTPQQTATQALSIKINPAPLAITTTTLPNGFLNTAYNSMLQSSGGTPPVAWTVTLGVLPGGLTLNSSTGAITGTPTATGTFDFTITATDSGVPAQTQSKALSIVVSVAQMVITTSTLPSGTVGAAYNATLQATGGTPPIAWAVTVGALPGGLALNSSTGAISGTPTTAAASNFTVQATDSSTPTAQVKTQALSIVINSSNPPCGTGSESKLNGQYAFLLQGFDASGPVAIAGSFTTNGTGTITAGQEDVNRISGVTNPAITTSGSSYSVGADNRGCLTIVAGGATSTYRFALGSINAGVAAKAHLVEFDSTGTNVVGVFEMQDPAAFSGSAFAGDFAFGAASPTLKSGVAARFGVAGRFTASGGALTAVVADVDDNGTPQAIPAFAGTYSVAASGRGTIILNPPGASTPVNASFYIVSANEALLMSIDPQTGVNANSLFAGSVLKQVGSPFGISSLNGTDVISLEGKGSSAGTSKVQVGLLVPAGNGTFTFATDKNDGGTVTSNPAVTANYSVSANGRVTISGAGSNPPVIYLVSQDKGFVVGTDNSVTTGFFEPQVGSSFTNASLSGNYIFGDQAPVVSTSSLSTGIANPNGTGSISGTTDNNQNGSLVAGQTFTAPYSVSSNGRTTIGTAPDTNVMYIISSSKAVFISTKTTKTDPTITVVEK